MRPLGCRCERPRRSFSWSACSGCIRAAAAAEPAMRRPLCWGWLISGSSRPRPERAAGQIKRWRLPLQASSGFDEPAATAEATTSPSDHKLQTSSTNHSLTAAAGVQVRGWAGLVLHCTATSAPASCSLSLTFSALLPVLTVPLQRACASLPRPNCTACFTLCLQGCQASLKTGACTQILHGHRIVDMHEPVLPAHVLNSKHGSLHRLTTLAMPRQLLGTSDCTDATRRPVCCYSLRSAHLVNVHIIAPVQAGADFARTCLQAKQPETFVSITSSAACDSDRRQHFASQQR